MLGMGTKAQVWDEMTMTRSGAAYLKGTFIFHHIHTCNAFGAYSV